MFLLRNCVTYMHQHNKFLVCECVLGNKTIKTELKFKEKQTDNLKT